MPLRVAVEQRDRRRLVAARVLVGVVADERRPGHGAVDATVDPGQLAGDPVHDPVEVVDPALQRDGEVDEVGGAAAEEDALRGAHLPQRADGPAAIAIATTPAAAAPTAIQAATEALTCTARA